VWREQVVLYPKELPGCSVGSLTASQEAHNSVQDVLCLRDGPVDAPTAKSKLPKARVPRKKHIMQEMEAPTGSTVGGVEPSDGRNHVSRRFASQNVPQEDSHERASATYITLRANLWPVGIARFDYKALASAT
jgi:hypothetical protein